MHPTSGPVDGNTPITIQGTNLGSSPSTVKVAIGSIPCNIVDYTISKQYVTVVIVTKVTSLCCCENPT